MTRTLWLPDKLREYGVTVDLTPGWETRGSDLFDPHGVVCHHTASVSTAETDLRIITNGRPDLPGPLSQVLLTRDGVAHVIASGKANHAGEGSWQGLSGNASVFGIEAANSGLGEPWPAVQIDAYHRVVAGMLDGIGADASWCCAHREWTPRKIDPAGIDMPPFRQSVQDLLDTGGDMALSDEDIKKLVLHQTLAIKELIAPDKTETVEGAVRRWVRQVNRDLWYGDDPNGTAEHVPGGLIRRVRNHFRDMDKK